MTTENHSGAIPLLDMGMGPVYAPGEEDGMNKVSQKKTEADVWHYEQEPAGSWSFDDAAKSYVRLSRAAMLASNAVVDVVDEAEASAFIKRVRLPGSAFVARQFGRLEAWKAARVERQAQAAFARGWA
jgi:hypothetical protein